MTYRTDQLSVLSLAVQTAEDVKTKQACQQALQYYALAATPEILAHIAKLERALTLIAEMDGYVPARSDWDMVSIARAALGDAT